MSLDVVFDDDAEAAASAPGARRTPAWVAAAVVLLVAVAVTAAAALLPRTDRPAAALLGEVSDLVDVADDEEPVQITLLNRRGGGAAVEIGPDGAVRAGRLDNPLPLGSVSEIVTAAAVLHQVDAGRVDVEDSAATHLPGALPSAVTVRHLLQHTSGLPALATEPGSVVVWSSQNEAMLRMLLAAVDDRPAEQVLRDVLHEAGAHATTVDEGPDTARVVSTPADVAAVLRALHDGTLLSGPTRQLMTDQLRDVTRSGEVQIGLGLVRFTGYGPLVGSFGVLDGRYLLVMHAPSTGRTAVWSAPSSVALQPTLRPVADFLTGTR